MNAADNTPSRLGRRSILLLGGAVLAVGAGLRAVPSSAAAASHAIPAPIQDAPVAAATAVAVLAGGCFWGVQGVFQHVDGVIRAVSGYAGGEQSTATYDDVCTGRTGHAEAVQVTFDPRAISYGRLLQIFFSAAHDPTQRDRQGPDVGTQYRSAIFPADPEQARLAQAYIAQLDTARAFEAPIATRIEPDRAFYPAEAYHQDFMVRHPGHPYIAVHDTPKLAELRRLFPDRFRPAPSLVTAG